MNLIKVKKIITPFKEIKNSFILFDRGRIIDVGDEKSWNRNKKNFRTNHNVVEFKDGIAVPGFIEIHTHGSMGFDYMDSTEEALRNILRYTAKGGASSVLATTSSGTIRNIVQTTQNAMKYRNGFEGTSKILGMHIESNYYNKQVPYKGAHPAEYLWNPREKEYNRILEYKDFIKMMTVAPELPGSLKLIKKLVHLGITAGIGHTGATYQQVLKSMECGASHIIHLYSGMSTVVRIGPFRVAGSLEAALCEDGLTIELISDLVHLPVELMRFALKCKGYDRTCIVTDSILAAGLKDGKYNIGGRITTIITNGVAMTPDKKSFVGSTIAMIDGVRNMVNKVGVPLNEAIKMATCVPAKVIGVENKKGSLEKGKDADILILDDKLKVKKLFVS